MLAYISTKEKIISYIKKNKLKVGDRLPSENELANLLGISRLTLREAINALKNEGIINSVQGRGTFLSGSIDNIANTLNNNLGISEMIIASGYEPGVMHFEKELVKAEGDVTVKLNIGEGTDVLVLKRIRTADGKPVVYSKTIFLQTFSSFSWDIRREYIYI